MDRYCENCGRMVGTKKNLAPGIICIVAGIVTFMFVPLVGWIVGPLLAIGGLVALIFGGHTCSICGGKRLLKEAPAKAENQA